MVLYMTIYGVLLLASSCINMIENICTIQYINCRILVNIHKPHFLTQMKIVLQCLTLSRNFMYLQSTISGWHKRGRPRLVTWYPTEAEFILSLLHSVDEGCGSTQRTRSLSKGSSGQGVKLTQYVLITDFYGTAFIRFLKLNKPVQN